VAPAEPLKLYLKPIFGLQIAKRRGKNATSVERRKIVISDHDTFFKQDPSKVK